MEQLQYNLLNEIKLSLYALLAAVIFVLLAVVFMSLKSEPKEEMLFGCGNALPSYIVKSAQYQLGNDLFKLNCASCHNKNMKDKLTGPALEDVESNWSKFPRKDLYNFIRHSQAMIKAKHPRALKLWKKHKPVIMNDFSSLTDEEIESILHYIKLQKSLYLYR